MRPRVAVFGALGTVATALAALVLFAPGPLGEETLTAVAGGLGDIEPRHVLLAASVLVGAVLSVVGWNAARSSRTARDAFDEATAGPPETVTAARQVRTAAGLGARFEAAVAGDDDAVDQVRERLRETASRAYARRHGVELAVARTAVRNGAWTDDATAAATLADGDGPTHSLSSRLRLWLDPESERERRFERAVGATRRLAGGEP